MRPNSHTEPTITDQKEDFRMVNRIRHHGKKLLAAGALLSLAGCVTDGSPSFDPDFHQDRFNQMQRLQSFEQCRNQGLQLDSDARARASVGAFRTSADVLGKCADELGKAARSVPAEERMRIHALSIVNYIRGGDVEMARRRFDAFKSAWPDNDLYLAGGVSFIATVETLLGRNESQTFGRFMALNVTDDVKSEMRRMNHWKNK